MTRDVSDITHRKRALRFEKSQLVEFLPGKKKVDFWGSSWPDEFVRYGRCALVGLRVDDVKAVSIKGLYVPLSPYVEKTFNSKVIKSFVPELRSRKCFLCFGIPMLSVNVRYGHYERFAYRYEDVYFTYSCMTM